MHKFSDGIMPLAAGPVIVWFRLDLRVGDNPALHAALETGRPIIPVFILDHAAAGEWEMGGATCWALHGALESLGHALPIVLRRGDSLSVLKNLIKETGAKAVFWNRRYEKWAVDQDIKIKETLKEMEIDCQSFNGKLLLEPWDIKTGSGTPYRVFTPYWRNVHTRLLQDHPVPLPSPKEFNLATLPKSEALKDWNLLPSAPDWAGGMRAMWQIDEKNAAQHLLDFIDDPIGHYTKERDFPAVSATSQLSPYLALGVISPRQIWYEISMAMEDGRISPAHHHQGESFLRQIVWREFSYHLLFYYPHSAVKALNEKYTAFPWRRSRKELKLWEKGQTGYPLVDAGMRQLWQTGWMHNRVRMVVASFLVKHLLLPWQDGAKWFWDTLVDADLANNTMGWQWVAGSGADAAPYFRIFNPITQSEKFDAKGDYIRAFVPELAKMPDKYIHAPWTAPGHILDDAGVVLGKDYPKPMIEHAVGRQRALEALKQMGEEIAV